MWFDSTDVSGTGVTPSSGSRFPPGRQTGNGRHMNIVNGDPTIAMDGHEGRTVVDFDGNDQLISTYDFAGADLQVWRNGDIRLLGSHGTRGGGATG